MSEIINCYACNQPLTEETTFTATSKDGAQVWHVHPEPCLDGLQRMLATIYGRCVAHYPEPQDGTAVLEF